MPVQVNHEKFVQVIKQAVKLSFDQSLIQLNAFFFKKLVQLVNGCLVTLPGFKGFAFNLKDTVGKGEQNGNSSILCPVDNWNPVPG